MGNAHTRRFFAINDSVLHAFSGVDLSGSVVFLIDGSGLHQAGTMGVGIAIAKEAPGEYWWTSCGFSTMQHGWLTRLHPTTGVRHLDVSIAEALAFSLTLEWLLVLTPRVTRVTIVLDRTQILCNLNGTACKNAEYGAICCWAADALERVLARYGSITFQAKSVRGWDVGSHAWPPHSSAMRSAREAIDRALDWNSYITESANTIHAHLVQFMSSEQDVVFSDIPSEQDVMSIDIGAFRDQRIERGRFRWLSFILSTQGAPLTAIARTTEAVA